MANRLLILVVMSLMLASGSASASGPTRPDLVVVISVDQMRADYLTRFAPWFSEGGFARLVREGASFQNAAHRHNITATGPGHATIGTGLDPREHAIAANDWFDRLADDDQNCVHDPHVTPTAESTERGSPWNLALRSLGDSVKERYHGAKVVGVSLKDRTAILMAGRKADAAYWFDERPGVFLSSSYYDWNPEVLRFNERLSSYREKYRTWELSGIIPVDDLERITWDPESLRQYKRDRYGMGTSFPHPLGNLDALQTSPFFDAILVDLAMHVIRVEEMGTADGRPDILFLGLSSVDYYGHAYGPDSMEIADGIVRLDRDVERLLEFLDQRLKGRWTVVLTADHGVQQIPEVAKAQGKDAGRFASPDPGNLATSLADLHPVRLALEKDLAKTLNVEVADSDPVDDRFVRTVAASGFYLNWTKVAGHGIEPETARKALRDAVLRLEGVRAAWTASDLLAATPPKSDLEEAVRRGFRPERSPDVVVALKPGWLFTSWTEGTTHGQAVEDDMRVPLVFCGVGVRKGSYDEEASPADIARSLGVLLGVSAGGRDTRALPAVVDR